ncbi:MAG: 4-(cytidine 5'-diphospho)-2-C-methyl-D-erythritol kinase [Dehalococcoidales bacterium]|nr:4-(cytidine 5'-diphospho)-2-C-methyl-D-erythritol kinase [Dehalococcoidales bacterium]
MKILAPAKINLTLEVLGKRADGYHEIRSVMQEIGLCDTLDFEASREFNITSDMPEWKASESLVAKAANLLREATGCGQGANIEVKKQIPLTSGLGGDSSDAAATLRGLNTLWKSGLSPQRLMELAPRLGSDVAFFLHGGTALAEGRGEKLTSLPPPPHARVVLVVPKVPLPPGKTAQLYSSLNSNHYTDGRITERLAEVLRNGGDLAPSLLFNTFENVAFDCFPGLKVYWSHILKLGADNLHLAGSGPTLFSVLKDKTQAADLAARCRHQGMAVYLAEMGR